MIAAIISLRYSRHARLDTATRTKGPYEGPRSVRAREFIDLHRQSGEHESERAGAAAPIGGED